MSDAAAALHSEDEAARSAALCAQHSLLLQAPAGSGKTTVLTARFLTLLAEVDAPEEILAITFTRKAAAEMRQRILKALQAAESGEVPSGLSAPLLQRAWQHDRQCGWELLRNPARLRVETIDALNNRLARMLPVSARAAPGLALARHPNTLYERAAARTLEAAWLEEASRPAAQLLFERLDNNWRRLQSLLTDMLRHRSHWLPRMLEVNGSGLVERVNQSLQSLLAAELAIACQVVPEELRLEGEALLAYLQRASGGAPPRLTAHSASLPDWRRLCRLALTNDGWRRRLTSADGFERDDRQTRDRAKAWIEAMAEAGLESTLRTLSALPDERLTAEEQGALTALAQLLVRAATELQVEFAQNGRVDYAYIAGAARASLSEQGAPTDLALRLGTRLRHILVDEFQDTSYEQFGLLQALTVGWEPQDGRTLFLVGDPMQSIYQFREAEVGLFLRARAHGIGPLKLQPLALRRNFRTQRTLLDWINTHFAQLFPRRDDPRTAAIAYLASAAARAERLAPDEQPVTLHRFPVGDRQGEALSVLQIVRSARQRDAHCSIAVLVANREHATRIAAVLREAQLPLRGVDLEPLRERAVIRDLTALTRALQHRADRSAWLALLRAPWCGLTLVELESFCAGVQADHFQALQACSADSAALARVQSALEPALLGAERALPLWQRVEHCWLRLGGPAIHRGEGERLDARRFLDALALHEEPAALVGEALEAELLDALYSAAPPQPDAIEIMTMHAAKGLEWDVVILPGLGRCSARDSDPLLHWLELPRPSGGTELLLSPIRASADDVSVSLATYIKRLRRERRRLERVRLLYVAATRARRQLHLLGAVPTRADGGARPPMGSALHDLWPAVGAQFAALEPTTLSTARVKATAAPLWRLPPTWQLPAPPPPPEPQRLSLPAGSVVAAPEYRWVGLTARAVGTIVHAELHRLALAATAVTAGASPRPQAHYARWLAELGVPDSALRGAAARIEQALLRTLAEPRGRWLLSDAHREARSEWRLTGLHEGRVVNVVFDRMLLDAQGLRWIVDFKTSSHEGGSVEQFLQSEVERHGPQLQRYAAVARSLGPEPLRLALYFPLLGAFRELDATQP
ncbi:MAG TPA: UvrD-helicase domain-containing protein [Steroidobacteraceae bacterium]|jgi:ATP-dependent exoDNAse (exonuclease V) beta subunit|nr:UvrD-helicase domain-containing protein [Steroidobacteraceae bacterium]